MILASRHTGGVLCRLRTSRPMFSQEGDVVNATCKNRLSVALVAAGVVIGLIAVACFQPTRAGTEVFRAPTTLTQIGTPITTATATKLCNAEGRSSGCRK